MANKDTDRGVWGAIAKPPGVYGYFPNVAMIRLFSMAFWLFLHQVVVECMGLRRRWRAFTNRHDRYSPMEYELLCEIYQNILSLMNTMHIDVNSDMFKNACMDWMRWYVRPENYECEVAGDSDSELFTYVVVGDQARCDIITSDIHTLLGGLTRKNYVVYYMAHANTYLNGTHLVPLNAIEYLNKRFRY